MRKRRRVGKSINAASRVVEKLDIPVSDEGAITETTVYPSIGAAFDDAIGSKPWFASYSPGTKQTLKYAFYTAAAEMLRTVAFRMNTDQNDSVFTDLGREIEAYDDELRAAARDVDSELH